MKRDATTPALQSRKSGLAGQESTSAPQDIATDSHRVVPCPRPKKVAAAGGVDQEMVDEEEEEEAAGEARDITMAESETEAATRPVTATETEIKTAGQATNDLTGPAQLRKVIQVDHCGAVDGNRMQCSRILLATATEKNRRDWDQRIGIRNKKQKMIVDSDIEGLWPGA